MTMKKWVRWQDWVALVAGVYAALSPIWTTTVDKATTTLIVLGVVTALVALWSLAAPGFVMTEGLVAVLGVLFFISPWVFSFQNTTGIAWTAWVVGVATFIAGAWALPVSNRVHHTGGARGLAAQH
jgi:VIT1/CCC1 family predicted Fe2+/Mn2+ transporter